MKGKAFYLVVGLVVVLGVGGLIWRGVWLQQQTPLDPNEWDLKRAQQELDVLRERLNSGEESSRRLADDYRELVERFPKFATARAEYAMVLYNIPNWEEAYEQVKQAIDLDDQRGDWHLLAGTVASNLGMTETASKHYEQAVSIQPDNADFLTHLAQTQINMRQFDEARMTLLQSFKFDAENHSAYGLMADLYARQNKMTLAIDAIKKAIDHTPPDLRPVQAAYIQRKAAYLRRNRQYKQALNVLNNELLSDDHLRPSVLQDLAVTYMLLGEPAKGAKAFEEAFKLVPADEALAAGAAHWRIKAGDLDKAGEHIAALRRLNPRDRRLAQLEQQLTAARNRPKPSESTDDKTPTSDAANADASGGNR